MVEAVPREVLLAARAGDEAAWTAVVRATEGPLVRFLFSRVRDDASARDLAQEVYVEALRAIGSLGEPWHVHGWLRRIASRKVARHIEAAARRPRPGSPLPDAAAPSAPADRTTELLARLERLPPHYREVLRLHYLEEVPVREVATRLALAAGTVKRRLFEGRRRMAGADRTERGVDERRRAVPPIEVRERAGRTLDTEICGPLVPWGSFLAAGDVEVFDGYHYPGGLWAERSESEVRREIRVGDLDAFEVHVSYLGDDRTRWAFGDEAEEFLYFHRDATGIRALLRISREQPAGPLSVEERPIVDDPLPAGPFTGPAVEVAIDGQSRGTCVRVRRRTAADADPAGRSSVADAYLTPEGRCVLFRRYNGPEWENYAELARSASLSIDGVEYRLWHDSILCA